MAEERDNLLPESPASAPPMHYDDLKLPLLNRGILIPAAMLDYINALAERHTRTDADIAEIRAEMLQVFEDAGQPVPSDFDENFERWFPQSK